MPTLFRVSKSKAKSKSTNPQESSSNADDYVTDELHRHEEFMSVIRARQRATLERIVHYSRCEELRSQDFQEFVAKANKEHDGNEARRRVLFAEAMKKHDAVAEKHEHRRVKEFAVDLLTWSKGIEEEKQKMNDAFKAEQAHLDAMFKTGFQVAQEFCCQLQSTLQARFDEIMVALEASFRHNELQRDVILQDLSGGRPLQNIQLNPSLKLPWFFPIEFGTSIDDYASMEYEHASVFSREDTDTEASSDESNKSDNDAKSFNSVDLSFVPPATFFDDKIDLEVVPSGLPKASVGIHLPTDLKAMVVKSQETPGILTQSDRFSAFQEWRRTSIAEIEADEVRMWKEVETKHETVKQLRDGIWTRTLQLMHDRLELLILDFEGEYESLEHLRNQDENRRNSAFKQTQRAARDAYRSFSSRIKLAIASKEEAQRNQGRVLSQQILGLCNQHVQRFRGALDDIIHRFNERQSDRLAIHGSLLDEGEYPTVFHNKQRELERDPRVFGGLPGYSLQSNRTPYAARLGWLSETASFGCGSTSYMTISQPSSRRKKHQEVPFGLAMLFQIGNMPSSLPLPGVESGCLKEQLQEEYTRFMKDQANKYAATTQEQEANHALDETIRQYGYEQDQRVRQHQFDEAERKQDKKVGHALSGFDKMFFEQESRRQQHYLTARASRTRAYAKGRERRMQRMTERFDEYRQEFALSERNRLLELVKLGT